MVINESWFVRPPGVPEDLDAGGVVVRSENNQWLVALVRERMTSHYILPKGKVETGESLEQAARREIQEEAGLRNLHLTAYLGSYERLNYARTRWKKTH